MNTVPETKFNFKCGYIRGAFTIHSPAWAQTKPKIEFLLDLLQKQKSGHQVEDIRADKKKFWELSDRKVAWEDFVEPDDHITSQYAYKPTSDISVNIVIDYDGEHCYLDYDYKQQRFTYRGYYICISLPREMNASIEERLHKVITINK